jgi:uncharacterized protein (TIGR03435 family)
MRATLAVLTAGAACAVAFAQAPAARAFDAVSIRESAPTDSAGGGMRLQRNGDIRVDHMSATTIVAIAHQLDSYRVVNAPDWANATYYDIVARANADSTRDETFAMMRAMLADRFKLGAHRETRPIQGFAIVRTGNPGPRLQPSTVNCEENARGPRCAEGAITSNSARIFGTPIANLIKIVGSVMRAPIVDKTGLTGTFDVDLRWSPDAAPTDDTPVMATALQEQLGLRLQREQVPLDVLVIDRIERPSQN